MSTPVTAGQPARPDPGGGSAGHASADLGQIAPLWTVEDVAAFLRVSVQTVYAWRAHGGGPPGRRVGKYVRYQPADVVDWFENGAA